MEHKILSLVMVQDFLMILASEIFSPKHGVISIMFFYRIGWGGPLHKL
jgi:hypothetical protein